MNTQMNIFINFATEMETRSQNIIGRQEELRILQDAVNSNESEFIAIYGRRRVGKTYLVNKAFKGKFARARA